jgi:hypothetical protein
MASLETRLRQEIKKQLEKCDSVSTPKICSIIKDAESYGRIEAQIIELVISSAISAGAAIGQIESEL